MAGFLPPTAFASNASIGSNPHMSRILLTAFRPFGGWDENASWLALQAVTRDLPSLVGGAGERVDLTTRLYPVDFEELLPRLASDLATPYDAILHVGQAEGASSIRLEQFALNAARSAVEPPEAVQPLEPGGPAAYQSRLPLTEWTLRLREAGIPAQLSLHAGDYLCNAAMYWSHHLLESSEIDARVGFVHVPLDLSQVARSSNEFPSMPTELTALALRLMIGWAAESTPPAPRFEAASAAGSGV